MKDDKYITLKRDEWDRARDTARVSNMAAFRVIADLESRQLSDAFVLRGQDRFTEAALNAYVSSLLTTSEILKDLPLGPMQRETMLALCDRLEGIADVAAQRAMEAHGATRMPT